MSRGFSRWLPASALALAVLGAGSARAHHGVAAISVAGPEGPGAGLETTSALTLPVSMGFAMVKSELVSFERFAHAAPENKGFALFNTAALGFGLRPWLSLYVFQPFNIKDQDTVGRNTGAGDPNLMLAFGFKLDEGLRLVPEKESLDELRDWHFALYAACTVPLGPTEHTDDRGQPFAPDMQTGFGKPSPLVGLSILKQLSDDVTWLADVSYQGFLAHSYSTTRYRFGAETRLGTAVAWRLVGGSKFRVDLIADLTGLNLQRDRERDATGDMTPLQASGGTILYAAAGLRLFHGPLSAAIGARRPIARRLNEAPEQQGSEGLESIRAMVSVSYVRRF